MVKAESPFLIVNPKSYLYGEKSLELAKAADKTAKETGLQIYFTCPYADIRLIKEKTGLHNLNEGLAEIAELRLQYPEATLKELGMMLSPQVGKSGVNHRLRKLSEIADELRTNEEEVL